MTRDELAQRVLPTLAVLLVGAVGCHPPASTALDLGKPRTDVGLDVRTSRLRPRLALLTRDTAGTGAVALALATAPGRTRAPVENRAVATLLANRLIGEGFLVTATSDGAGLRLSAPARDGAAATATIAAFERAVRAPLASGEAEAVRRALAVGAMRRVPVPMRALATCSGDDGAMADEPLPEASDEAIEAWRSGVLIDGRVAVGAVGARELTDAVAARIEDGATWPLTTRTVPAAAAESSHALTVGPMAQGGAPVLDVVWSLPDPRRALQLATQLEGPRSPLRAKLAQRDGRWSIDDVRATARVDGGCIRLRLVAPGLPRDRLVASSADAFELADDDIRRSLEEPLDGTLVADRIASAADAASAAERAAWWSLSSATANHEPIASSVASIPSERGDDDQTLSNLDLAYRSAIYERTIHGRSQGASSPTSIRTSVAPEQAESWLLIANGCAAARESGWDAGRSALAAMTAAETNTTDGITLEAWIRPDGIGLLAHGARRTDEPGTSMGRRLGSALGAALTSLPFSRERYARAQGRLLALPARSADPALEALAFRVVPHQPSLLLPSGVLETQVAAAIGDVDARWRSLLDEPWTLALLASSDESEAGAVTSELERWVRRPMRSACEPSSATALPLTGEHRTRIKGAAPRVRVAARSGSADEWPSVELLAAALDGTLLAPGTGSPARMRTRWLGGRRAPTLVVECLATNDTLPAVARALRNRLAALQREALPREAFEGAVRTVEERRRRDRSEARGRIEELWSGGTRPVARAEAVERWARERLAETHLVTLLEESE